VDCENGPIDNTLLQFFNGKTILVTGASGYIATNLINSLLPISCTIVRLSRNGNLLPLKGMANIIDVIGNIREINIWQQALENIGFKPQWDIGKEILSTIDLLKDANNNVGPSKEVYGVDTGETSRCL